MTTDERIESAGELERWDLARPRLRGATTPPSAPDALLSTAFSNEMRCFQEEQQQRSELLAQKQRPILGNTDQGAYPPAVAMLCSSIAAARSLFSFVSEASFALTP